MNHHELGTAGGDLVRARVTLGRSDITMRPIGLGCMTMSQSYGHADRETRIATIREAIDLRVGMLAPRTSTVPPMPRLAHPSRALGTTRS